MKGGITLLEIKQPGRRLSSFFDGNGGTLYQGLWVTPTGHCTASAGLGGSSFRPGFAQTGDSLMTIATSGQTLFDSGSTPLLTNKPCYPVKRLNYKLETSELNLDTIASGEYFVYYEGGEYETDRHALTSPSTVTYGTKLYLNGSGWLTDTTGTSNLHPVAMAIDYVASHDTNYHASGILWFRTT